MLIEWKAEKSVNDNDAPNNGMHPTADTTALIYFQSFGAAGNG
jgi:hypothetical protein